MASIEFRKGLFRTHDAEEGSRVTQIELFFDLVFVFAVTQLSHRLLDHLTLRGGIETLVLFLAIWWLWINTSWATNWLDPEKGLVRGLLIAMMLGGLALSGALSKAFDGGGIVFAVSYVALQFVRTVLVVWAAWGHHEARVRNFLRIGFYFALSAPLWIAGALAEPNMRLLFWTAALAVEYAAPSLSFLTPGLGRSTATDWDISGAHMAERCGLFIILSLGETILITGQTFAKLEPTAPTIAAFISSFAASAAMWWIYFDTGAKRGGDALEDDDTGRVALNGYTYLHLPIVAGIVVAAVGDELMLAHPLDHATPEFVIVTCGGPLLFLIGNQVFKFMTADRPMPPLSHFVGEALLIAIAVTGWFAHWPPIAIGSAAAGALIATAFWEWFSVNGGWQRWAPWVPGTRKIAPDDAAG